MKNFIDTKGLIGSTTIWGALISLAPLVNEVVVAVPEATAIVTGAVGSLIAIFGRLRAKSRIKGLF